MRVSARRPPRVLIVGPLPPAVPTYDNPVGGASVNFSETVRELRERGFQLDVISLTRPRVNIHRLRLWSNNLTKALEVLWSICARVWRNDLVMLNLGRAWPLGLFVWFVCHMSSRPLVLRILGGGFADVYNAHGRFVRWWTDRTYIRSSRVFVQTQRIVRRFEHRGNFRWFPNTRDVRSPHVECRRVARRFLFVAQLRMEKGLREALEASRNLPNGCGLSVYGPRMPNTDLSMFDGNDRAVYEGVLLPDEVAGVIADHDVLLLPSYFQSEGHPGIILEAFQCGRPVISTWWNSIPEVVEDGVSGLLVRPRSAATLSEAMVSVATDPELYRRLCCGALTRGEFFRSGTWYDRMAEDLCGLALQRKKNTWRND